MAGIALFGGALLVALWHLRASPDRTRAEDDGLIVQAEAALRRSRYALAEDLASRVDPDHEEWARAQLVAGEAATRAERYEAALDYYASIAWDDSDAGVLAAYSYAEVCRHIGRLSDAEEAYRIVLRRRPDHAAAHERMAFLLGVTGRRWESLPNFMFLVRSGEWTLESLALLGDLERPMEQEEYLRRCAENSPDDVLVKLGLGAHALAEGEAVEARRLLRQVVEEAPHLLAAQAMLGELLVDGDDRAFLDWHAALPPSADDYCDIWYVRGLGVRRRGELQAAARCFWEAVRRAPTHRRASYQLGQVLISLGEESGEDFVERARRLYELTFALDEVLLSQGRHEQSLRKVTELMEETGRVWEAWAWAGTAVELFPGAHWPDGILERLTPLLHEDLPQTLPSANLATRHDFSRFPDHEELFEPADIRTAPRPFGGRSSIRFTETSHAGIDFVYVNGDDPTTKGARVFEQNGGGAAAIDFDADGRPDLYFTQGAEWEQGAPEPSFAAGLVDRLYRNIGGRAFRDATGSARLEDSGFGQGLAAGDIDNDGFTDLYVANIGRNRLYLNNGDGTFSASGEECGLDAEDWTASCVIVDLNADGLPDLFDVNYLTGPDVYELICEGRACSPKVFDGVGDRLYVNRGDGTFDFVPVDAPPETSKGLGVVAVDLHHRGRPCLFIANDQVPNHFLRSEPSQDRHNIRLSEEAFLNGLAFNEDGLPMACMGIAADDADGNGLIDFFVTNFQDEANTLYLQDAPGLWVDATKPAGLAAPSWSYVGWGTQFLDADLDGAPDLVLVNGHVDDYRDVGGEYHMRPQLFRNVGVGRFEELFPDEAGEYFGKEFLGRGLARLDWNGDGRMDFIVSNIGQRASLVSNVSTNVGPFLNVRLHATASARDAIGTVVEVVAADRRWTKQLTAGDGYMASNERLLQFGLGDAAAVDEVRIHWPSGRQSLIVNPPLDATIRIAEGGATGTVLRDGRLESIAVQ